MVFLVIVTNSLFGQSDVDIKILDKELSLHVDNDAMLLANEFDKYYSSGIFASFRRLLRPETIGYKIGRSESLSKAIIGYELFHRMYTPANIKKSNAAEIDRPYAGWFGAAIELNYYYTYDGAFSLKIDAGWLGPSTRTDDVQIWWHDVLNMKEPRGWEYQINDTFAGHVLASYQRKLIGGNVADLIGLAAVQLGTIRNNARAGGQFRIGMINPLINSVASGSKMGQQRVKIKSIPESIRVQEMYFFMKFTTEYVIYNATIEGNVLGEPSAFTKQAKTVVFHQEYGFARSGAYFDIYMSLVFRSPEVIDAGRHQYMTIKLVHRI